MKKIKNYFKVLFYALLGKAKIKEDEFQLFSKKHVSDIKRLLDAGKPIPEKDVERIRKGLIENRKKINEYKTNYTRFVGTKNLPEEVKKIVESDSKLDWTMMNRKQAGYQPIEKVARILKEKLETKNK